MAKNKVREAVRFFQKCLDETGLHVSKLILFGSQAKGTAKGDSDIDLLIVAEDFRAKNIFQRALLTKDAEIKTIKKFLIPLDIITLTPEEFEGETSLAATYAKSGKVLQAASRVEIRDGFRFKEMQEMRTSLQLSPSSVFSSKQIPVRDCPGGILATLTLPADSPPPLITPSSSVPPNPSSGRG